jgi:phage terminase small subunit
MTTETQAYIEQPDPLTLIEENFALEMARHNDIRTAYRVAVDDQQAGNLIALRQGQALLSRPGVAERIRMIRERASQLSSLSVATVLSHWWNLAIADPNELVQLRRVNCRYCYGEGHQYQWTVGEMAKAQAEAYDDGREFLQVHGGVGFDGTRGPNPACPECFGEGKESVFKADTRYLSERGKLLYAGIKPTRFGVEVVMRDQAEAMTNLAKFLGMFQERVIVEQLATPEGSAPRLDLSEMSLEALSAKFRELSA